MGSAAGSLYQEHSKDEILGRSSKYSNMLSIFVGRSVTTALKDLESNNNSRKAFASYLKNGGWFEKLPKFENSFQREATKGQDHSHLVERCLAVTMDEFDPLEKQFSEDGSCEDVSSFNQTCFKDSQLRGFLFALVYPIYTKSVEYRYWKQHQDDANFEPIMIADDFAAAADKSWISSQNNSARDCTAASSASALSGRSGPATISSSYHTRLNDALLCTAAALGTEVEIEQQLASSQWVADYLGAIDECSMGITVSAAQGDDDATWNTFPLLYGNREFCRLLAGAGSTGQRYVGNMVADKKDFTACCVADDITDTDAGEKIRTALLLGKQARVTVQTPKRNGSTFSNLLSFQPVEDCRGQSRYILATHINIADLAMSSSSAKGGGPGITLHHLRAHQLQQMDDIFSLVASVLSCNYPVDEVVDVMADSSSVSGGAVASLTTGAAAAVVPKLAFLPPPSGSLAEEQLHLVKSRCTL